MAWVLDVVKRMVERYPNSTNPLAEPAIVLVDEIDLHLHPEWQRKIIAHLTKYFPNTQFIVTAHSPLIVQSAENVNLVMLKKHDDHVTIEQRPNACYQGWSVEDIMSELMMDNENHIYSDRYNRLWDDFANGIEDDDYPKAKKAYNELMRLLPPSSSQRKVLEIQMTALKPMLV
jgi:predicted ATP-binding protein involved in virulence